MENKKRKSTGGGKTKSSLSRLKVGKVFKKEDFKKPGRTSKFASDLSESDKKPYSQRHNRGYGVKPGGKSDNKESFGERKSTGGLSSRASSSSLGGKKSTYGGAEKRTDKPYTKKPKEDSVGLGYGKSPFTNKLGKQKDDFDEFDEQSYQRLEGKKDYVQPKERNDKPSRVRKTVAKNPTDFKPGKRLNRYIANAGICSRREADKLIKEGLIEVNGKVVTELGVMVYDGDVVKYDGRVLKSEKNVYVLLNKPKDFITTTNDPQERKTVMNLVANACKERIYPVGRLDRQTTGLLLFTNDGELAEKLTHPSYQVKKIYEVELDRPLDPKDAEAIMDGLFFEEGKAVVDSMAVLDQTRKRIGIEIHIGWNRIVRRIFEAKGYKVERLDRVYYAGLTKKDLPRGTWRHLTEKEVIMLKHFKS
jgi:23S rRNA pseudouridine2605 synthase